MDIAIVGAGAAGLSAAVFGAKAGFSVRVFEKHSIPGGLATSWKRKGFTFDYCVDYFWGSGKNQGFYSLWKDLGVAESTTFLPMEAFGSFVGSRGETVNLYTDHRRLEKHLRELSPGDGPMIRAFCRAMAQVRQFHLTTLSFRWTQIPQILASLSSLLVLARWSKTTVAQWSAGFQCPLLREALPDIVGRDTPMAGVLLVLGMMHRRGIGYPLGGSLPLMEVMEKKARSLGAEFVYNAPVRRLLVDQGRVRGLELEGGQIQTARYVVSAGDLHSLFRHLLEGKVSHPEYDRMFAASPLHRSVVQISLGVQVDKTWNLDSAPHSISLPLKQPLIFEGSPVERLTVRHYTEDPSMAPPGCTVFLVRMVSRYDYWEEKKKDPAAYRTEKTQVLERTMEALEPWFPGLRDRVMATDVATPVSCVRYTENYRGSTQGWLMTTELMEKMRQGYTLPRELPEVKNLILAGQWTEPGGGLPPSARSGKEAIQILKRKEAERP